MTTALVTGAGRGIGRAIALGRVQAPDDAAGNAGVPGRTGFGLHDRAVGHDREEGS